MQTFIESNPNRVVENLGISAAIDGEIGIANRQFFVDTFIDEIDAGIPGNQTMFSLANSKKNASSFGKTLKRYIMFWKTPEDEVFQRVMRHLYEQLDRGHTLSESIDQLPKAFGADFRSLFIAAEATGRWTSSTTSDRSKEGILNLLSRQLERQAAVESKIKGAMGYPIFILGFTFVMVLVFAFAVLPKLKDFFDGLNIKNLNFAATTMLAAGDFINNYYLISLFITVITVALMILLWKTEGKVLWQKYQFSFPSLGKVVRDLTVAQIFCLLSTLQDAGIIPAKNLEILAKVSTNIFLRESIEKARDQILRGKSFSETLGKCHQVFEATEFNLLVSAEKSGTISTRPLKHAEKLFKIAEKDIDRLISLIQPAMIIVVGAVIGFLVIGFYSAMFGAIGQFSGAH